MKERSVIGGLTEYQDENTHSKLVEECVVEIEYSNRNNYDYFRTIIFEFHISFGVTATQFSTIHKRKFVIIANWVWLQMIKICSKASLKVHCILV